MSRCLVNNRIILSDQYYASLNVFYFPPQQISEMLAGSLSQEDEDAVLAELEAIIQVHSSLSEQVPAYFRLICFGVFFSSFYCLKRSDFFCFKGWRFSTSWSAHWALACSARAKEGCERLKAQMQHYFKLPVCGSLSLSLTFCSCLVSREKTSGSEAGWRGSVGVVADGLAIRIAHTLISLNTKTQAHREHTVLSCQLFQWFFLNLTQHMHCMYWLYLLWWG